MNEYVERSQRAQAALAAADCDWLFVSHSTDLLYLIGFTKRPSERLALLLIPREGRAKMVVPGFELPVFQPYASFFDLIGWEETEDPVAKVREVVGAGAGQTIAIADQLHTVFTLRLQAALAGASWLEGNHVLARIRMVKTASEIDALRDAAAKTEDALASLFSHPIVGKTELEVLRFLHRGLAERGLELSGGGIVGAGPNSASPHHKTGERRLAKGDAVVIDFGGGWRGYRSDITRSFHVGEPPPEFRRIYQITQEAQQLAFEAVRPGVTTEQIDSVARDYITAQGYGPAFLHRTGHGIGLDGHEYPYLVQGDTTVLEEGMTFSIEPGIYLAGKYGVRIEDIVAVTATGAERLNLFPRDLRIID